MTVGYLIKLFGVNITRDIVAGVMQHGFRTVLQLIDLIVEVIMTV